MTLLEAVKATYDVVGQATTDIQLAVTVEEVDGYPLPAVLSALSRCRKELRKLTLADILDRLPGGHPGPEEAWAMIAKAMGNEALSLVWTDEMREAYGVACGVSDDPVQARMAFKETYQRAVSEARAQRQSPRWSASLGHDPQGREGAVLEAVQKGRLTATHAKQLVPSLPDLSPEIMQIVGKVMAS